jgi:hypothetical protein
VRIATKGCELLHQQKPKTKNNKKQTNNRERTNSEGEYTTRTDSFLPEEKITTTPHAEKERKSHPKQQQRALP